MRLTLRAKLFAIAAIIAGAFSLLIAASAIISDQTNDELSRIQSHYLPRLRLGPSLKHEFEALTRTFQDAVAAKELDSFEQARVLKDDLIASLASPELDPGQAAALRAAVQDYYTTAQDVSRRLIDGEAAGEALGTAISEMQAKQKQVSTMLDGAVAFDGAELTRAFDAATAAQAAGGHVRLAISIGCMLVVLLLIFLVGRDMLRSLGAVNDGLERFGTGVFGIHIDGLGNDELGDVARRANQMADNLQRLATDRDREDWLRTGHAGLVKELRGELDPAEVAERAAQFLSRYVEAAACALYYRDDLGVLTQRSSCGGPQFDATRSFVDGEGLVGQAAQRDTVTVITEVPDGYLRIQSGLGEASPRTLALVPLLHAGRVRGVLELAFFKAWTPLAAELLTQVRETLSIAIEVALARAQTKRLLSETQAQAERLTTQEEELRASNEELRSQREDVQRANEELTQQRQVLQERNRELEATRRDLEEQTRELATVSSYKSQFLTNMSHELRTPLNSMLLLSKLLSENEHKNLTEKQVEFCKTIHAAGKDLLTLINQVLDLAKVEAGKQEIHVGSVAIADIAERARRVFEPLAKDKGLTFTVDVDSAVPVTIASDRQRVDQIVTNLVANAIKFTEQGQVSLSIRLPSAGTVVAKGKLATEKAIAFVVTDTGRGIPQHDQERIFAPFEQVESQADRRHGGTGLGLAISRELAMLLGGELVLAESRLGAGSTFVCHLPFEAPESVEPPKAVSRASPRRVPASSATPLLLLIEDDRVFADTFGEVIDSLGVSHLHASDGATGLALARSRAPTGILLDVKLPDMNGFELIEQLQRDPLTSGIPVYFVSGVAAADRGLALGAVGYVTKPASRAELLRVVRSLTVRAEADSGRILFVGTAAETEKSLRAQLDEEALVIESVPTAAQALAKLETQSFACMLLDLSVADMTGLELLDVLQRREGTRMPAVVVYTPQSLSREESQALERYSEAIVLKEGSSTERLLGEIRLIVRRLREGTGARRPPLTPATSSPRTTNVKLDGKTVLVVDDDMRTVYALSAILRAKGAQVIVADSGRAALEQLAKTPDLDAVLMDIMMPEMDGYEAMQRIRREQRFSRLPIIALTAKAMKGDEERCLEAGASSYLPKPIDAERLLPMLHSQLTR